MLSSLLNDVRHLMECPNPPKLLSSLINLYKAVKNLLPASKSFTFNKGSLVSRTLKLTILLTVIFVVSVIGSYQVKYIEAQSTNTSSLFEFFEKGNSLHSLGRYEEAITLYDKALEVDP